MSAAYGGKFGRLALPRRRALLSADLQTLVAQASALEGENRELRLKVKRLEGRVRQLERQEQASAGPEPWEVLGVAASATAEQVLAAFRSLAREHHPDLGGDPERFHALVTARDALIPS